MSEIAEAGNDSFTKSNAQEEGSSDEFKKQKVIFSAARIFYGGCFGCLVNGGGVSGHW